MEPQEPKFCSEAISAQCTYVDWLNIHILDRIRIDAAWGKPLPEKEKNIETAQRSIAVEYFSKGRSRHHQGRIIRKPL